MKTIRGPVMGPILETHVGTWLHIRRLRNGVMVEIPDRQSLILCDSEIDEFADALKKFVQACNDERSLEKED